jgi:fimbrial chaperone protein
MRRGLDPDQELSYRIFLQEVPLPPSEGDAGAKIALRIGLPVFVSPIAVRRMDVRWDLVTSDPKGMTVRATNAGNVHSQILGFKVRDPSHPNASSTQDAAYLLPGQSREWTLTGPPQMGPDQIQLDLRTDQGEQRVAVTTLKLENAGM